MSEQTINVAALAAKYPAKKQKKENKPEEVKVETPKVEEVKAEVVETPVETPKPEEVKPEAPKAEEAKPAEEANIFEVPSIPKGQEAKPAEAPTKTEDEKIDDLQVINFFKQPKEAIELLCSIFGISKEILENPIIKALFPIPEMKKAEDNILLKNFEIIFKDFEAIVKGISMRFKNVNDIEDRQHLLNGLRDSYATFSVRIKGVMDAYRNGTL
jgi:hypothetical protein